jgi:hypothetical protein
VSSRRASIAQVMIVVAIVAVNLGLLRVTPMEIVTFPTVWVLLGTIDFVVIWKIVLTRALRAFHYTFLIVFVIAYLVLAYFVSMERLHPLGLLVRWYQQLAGEKTNLISLGWLRRAESEIWMACFLSLLLACATGSVAAWLESRRGWDIAAFFRGALVGLGIAMLLAMIDDAVWGSVAKSPARWIGRWVLLGACLVLGGSIGLSRMKSTRTDLESYSP